MAEIDAAVAARKIRAALNELLDGATAHLEDLGEQGRLADESQDEDSGPSDDEIESTKKVIAGIEETLDKFDEVIAELAS